MEIGTKLAGRYEVVREIGRGGMGVVYLGRDPILGRDVALKLIASARVDADSVKRFMNEARLIAKMDHPSIVPIYDIVDHHGDLALVLPYIRGKTLRQYAETTSLRLVDVLDIGAGAASALHYSHELGIVHRDVKPENMMIESHGEGLRTRLTDFGLAIVAGERRITSTGALIGTVGYLSPEQIAQGHFDARSDVYALGTVLYELLAGTPPFDGDLQGVLYRIVHEPAPALRACVPDVDPELESLIMSCLAKDPANRPESAGKVSERLVAYRALVGSSERGVTTLPTVRLDSGVRRHTALPLVGRDRELGELCARLDAAVGGHVELCLVTGERGIGKTRLIEELERICTSRHIRVLRAHGGDKSAALPYQAFCEAIEQYCRSASATSQPPADFGDLRYELVTHFPLLRDVPLIGVRDSLGARRDDKEPDRVALFELLARAFNRIAEAGPLVLVFEDLHGEALTVDALQYIARRLSACPVLIVGSYLSTEVDRAHPLTALLDSFRGSRRFLHQVLSRLSAQDHRRLVATQLPGAGLNDALALRLYELTDGSPYFTVELIRELLDTGSLTRSGDTGWTVSLDAPLSYEALPSTIHQAVEARLARLDERLERTLRAASVLGTSFESRLLEELIDDVDDLDSAMDALVARGFLKEERRSDRISFTSGVVHGVLYASIPRRQRRRLHQRAAELVERKYRGRIEQVQGLLVHHYAEADEGARVCELGIDLARRSLAAFAADEAISAAKTVLAFTEDAGERARRVEADAHLLHARGLRMKSDLAGASRELERAMKAATEREAELEIALEATEVAWEGRRLGETRRWLERATPIARELAHPRLQETLMLAATVANLQGDPRTAHGFVHEAEQVALASAKPQPSIATGDALEVAFTRTIRSIDPAELHMDVEVEVSACCFDTLVIVDEHGYPMPQLCLSWEALDDGARFVFTLHPDARLHDGRPLSAVLVKESFERIIRLRNPLPPAFAPLRGMEDYLAQKVDGVSGIEAESHDRLVLRLQEPLRIYPALLSDHNTAIACPDDAGRLVGTGPYEVTERREGRLTLEPSRHPWRSEAPLLAEIAFTGGLSTDAVVRGIRALEIDIAGDLPPSDVEALLSDRHLGARLLDVPRKAIWFALFDEASPLGSHAQARRALFDVVPVQALVWKHLAATAQPTTGLIPQGVLGHDPGRRRRRLLPDEARALLASAPRVGTLRVAVSPVLMARRRAFVDELFAVWREIGIAIDIVADDEESYSRSWHQPAAIDVLIGGWVADYDDPDAFTHPLFHSREGRLRHYAASAELDEWMTAARHEPSLERRANLYRRVEASLIDEHRLLPLFVESDLRVVGPTVTGLIARAAPPYVNYPSIGKRREPVSQRQHRGGLLDVPIVEALDSLDPAYIDTRTQWELMTLAFESLAREAHGARVVPWLAESIEPEDGARRYRIRLRNDVRFHDGRRLTTRDVRYSWERMLRRAVDDRRRSALLAVAGAARVASGEDEALSGVSIVSPTELTVELTEPLAIFPALLTDPASAVVPEGTRDFANSFAEGLVGTGPFRVQRFEPGVKLVLEVNPHYWRRGWPRSDGITFRLNVTPDVAAEELRGGRSSVASDLLPADIEAFRQTPHETTLLELPSLSTNLLVFNIHRPRFRDVRVRRHLAALLPVEDMVRQYLGSQVIYASSFMPPELFGQEPVEPKRWADRDTPALAGPIRVELSPSFESFLAPFTHALLDALAGFGFSIETVSYRTVPRDTVDILLVGWGADYPDPDSFVYRSFHSTEGAYGPMCGQPELDEILTRARVETSRATRRTLYQRVEQYIADNALARPLAHPNRYWVAHKNIRGLVREAVGLTRGLDYAALWMEM